MTSNIEGLKDYSRINYRICPMPQNWNELFNLLRYKKPKEPSVPLILAAWWEVTAQDKQNRFFEHLEWTGKQGQINEMSDYISNYTHLKISLSYLKQICQKTIST